MKPSAMQLPELATVRLKYLIQPALQASSE
jgi:hypothetical protein